MRVPYNASVFRELSIVHRSRPFTLRMQAVTERVTATVHTVTGWVKGTPEMRAYTPREERISVLYTRSTARLAVLASKLGAQDLHAITTAAVLHGRATDDASRMLCAVCQYRYRRHKVSARGARRSPLEGNH